MLFRLRRSRPVKPAPLRVSVIIPLYNHARYIERTILSVLKQSLPAHEIIVIDDGSTDDSAAIAGRMALEIPNLILWSRPNTGAHTAINDGMRRATGELIAILNSDDLYHPSRLEKLASLFAADATLDAAVTTIEFVDGDGQETRSDWYQQAIAYFRSIGDIALALINSNFIMTTSNLLLRRSVIDEIGEFCAMRYAHDLDYFLRLVAQRRNLKIVDEPLLKYRVHDGNTVKEGHLKVKAEWAACTAFYLYRMQTASSEWVRIAEMLKILEKHHLLSPVLLCLGYFLKHPAQTMERHPLLRDAGFLEVLKSVVR